MRKKRKEGKKKGRDGGNKGGREGGRKRGRDERREGKLYPGPETMLRVSTCAQYAERRIQSSTRSQHYSSGHRTMSQKINFSQQGEGTCLTCMETLVLPSVPQEPLSNAGCDPGESQHPGIQAAPQFQGQAFQPTGQECLGMAPGPLSTARNAPVSLVPTNHS